MTDLLCLYFCKLPNLTSLLPRLFAVVLQVRRMTGALVAVGQGKLSISQLEKLLEAQDSLAYPQNLTAPPQGLFLTQVEYQQQGEMLQLSSRVLNAPAAH